MQRIQQKSAKPVTSNVSYAKIDSTSKVHPIAPQLPK
jgi:hypothetical protein